MVINTEKIAELIKTQAAARTHYVKSLGVFDLLCLGLGTIIGAGIFVITGIAAARYAGPAVIFSFVIAGTLCFTIALCYSEIASMINTSGGAYAYANIIFGKKVAWFVGWFMLIDFFVGGASIASSWSDYLVSILHTVNIDLPENWIKSPARGGLLKLPAVLIVAFLAFSVIIGTKKGIFLNNILVVIKIVTILVFIALAIPDMDMAKNWADFDPFGVSGIFKGASSIFFAYIGFEAIANVVQECKNPKRDIKIGILGSLLISTLLYLAVSAMLTLIEPYYRLDNAAPISNALIHHHHSIGAIFVAIGAMAGLTTVLFGTMLTQSRVIFAMAKDGLLPEFMTKVHKKYKSNYIIDLLGASIIAVLASSLPLTVLADLTSLGVLIAFSILPLAVIILRKKLPEAERAFACPWVGVTPYLGLLLSLVLICYIVARNFYLCLIWIFVGAVIYFVQAKLHRNHQINAQSGT